MCIFHALRGFRAFVARDTYPITVEYSLTDYGKTLEPLVTALREWGIKHREKVFENN
jgi:DNA-binding HxlR family transcriptional regulator